MGGKIYLVGIGPGNSENITPGALDRIKNAQVIIGHKSCLNIIKTHLSGKEIVSDAMSPVERAGLAVDKALAGNDVVLISLGDPGIYAIASTFFSYIKEQNIKIETEVVPGITTASEAAALLGSPMGHDFAVISLADMAASWRATQNRLKCVAEGDFVIVIYNPVGKAGRRRINRAIDILKAYRKPSTPVGIVTMAATDGEKVQITSLRKLPDCDIDIDSILIIGNARTFVFNGRMVTPRKYKQGVGY